MKFENIKYTPTLDRILEKRKSMLTNINMAPLKVLIYWLQWQRPQVQLHTASLLE